MRFGHYLVYLLYICICKNIHSCSLSQTIELHRSNIIVENQFLATMCPQVTNSHTHIYIYIHTHARVYIYIFFNLYSPIQPRITAIMIYLPKIQGLFYIQTYRIHRNLFTAAIAAGIWGWCLPLEHWHLESTCCAKLRVCWVDSMCFPYFPLFSQ